VVLDGHGRELWRKDFGALLEQSYAPEFPLQRYVWLGDLDGDGTTEVLFVQLPQDPLDTERGLWCFSSTGRVKWRFQPGRTMRSHTGQTFPPPYRILQLTVGPVGPRGTLGIALSSVQVPWWASQIALLDVEGKLVREYWQNGAPLCPQARAAQS
jgi:hypothetical protein